MARPNKHEYNKLSSKSSIRLMRLLPGNGMEPLKCEIDTDSIEAEPVYDALSYVWGDRKWQPGMVVSTATGDAWLQINFSLATYLHRFRSRTASRTLWVDSVCINQEDVKERNQQVRLMDQIYRKASAVMIWLGEDPDDEKPRMACACMNHLVAALPRLDNEQDHRFEGLYKNTSDINSWLGITRRTTDDIYHELGLPLPNSPEWQALIELLDNPWFTRAWTWQESFLAKERHFRRNAWSWPTALMQRAALALLKLDKITDNSNGLRLWNVLPMVNGQDFWTRRSASDKTWLKLEKLLAVRRGSGCKVPHDLVYSLLGAAWECPNVQIDYRKPFEEIYSELAWQLMAQQGNLNLLADVGVNRAVSNLPSWVPDWREKLDTSGIQTQGAYRATGSSQCSGSLSEDRRILSVFGICCDYITATKSRSASDVEAWVDSMINKVVDGKNYYHPTRESLERALRRVFFLDTTRFLGFQTHDRWQLDSHQRYEDIVANALRNEEGRVAYGNLINAMVRIGSSRNLIVTKDGLLGMAADIVQPGDAIVLLLGSTAPSVLRPLNELGHYMYIADCYLHGYMDGEALVDAWKICHPEGNLQDVFWLESLHLQDPPFPIESFHIH